MRYSIEGKSVAVRVVATWSRAAAVVFCVGLAIPVLAVAPQDSEEDAPPAEPAKVKPAEDQASKIEKEFEQFQQKVNKQLDELTAGQDKLAQKVEKLTGTLTNEYKANNQEIAALQRDELASFKQADRLVRRQRLIIALIDQLGGVQVNQSTNQQAARKLMSEVSREMRKYTTKPELRDKAMELYRAVSERAYNRNARQINRGRPGAQLPAIATPGFDSGDVHQVRAALARGPIYDSRRQIQSLLKLAWSGERMSIDRNHWPRQFGGRSSSDIHDEVKDMLQGEGVDETLLEPDPRLGQKPVADGAQRGPMELFQRLNSRSSVRAQSYPSASGRSSFKDGKMSADLIWGPSNFLLQIIEQADPHHTLRVNQWDDGSLKIHILTNELDFVFTQKKDGAIKLVDLTEEEDVILRAEDFRELYRENRQYVEANMLPLLDSIGIVPPLHYGDRLVRHRVASQLRFRASDDRAGLDQLLAALDSDEYVLREAASRKLDAEYERFRVGLQRDGLLNKLSLEVRTRVQKISQSQGAFFQEVDAFINSMKLTEDVPFLIELLATATADQKPSIAAQLSELTGTSFGADVGSWNKWLAERKPAK